MTNAKYLFGCSSIMTVSPVTAKAIYKTMTNNQMTSEEFGIRPRSKYKMSFSGISGEDLFEEKFLMGGSLHFYAAILMLVQEFLGNRPR